VFAAGPVVGTADLLAAQRSRQGPLVTGTSAGSINSDVGEIELLMQAQTAGIQEIGADQSIGRGAGRVRIRAAGSGVSAGEDGFHRVSGHYRANSIAAASVSHFNVDTRPPVPHVPKL